ncbi:MAG: hypothetical protein GXP54_11370 [Deltaproteobacteria bacterium]|nr:hypothetical protein [Deltaproteobacteria bacterium]
MKGRRSSIVGEVMRRSIESAVVVPMLAFLTAFPTGCGDSGGTNDVIGPGAPDPGGEVSTIDTLEGWVQEGKRQLEKGESWFAVKAFDEALEIAPDDTNAVFGKALSEMVYGSELFLMVLSLTDQLAAEPEHGDMVREAGEITHAFAAVSSALKAPPDDWSQNEYLAGEIHRIFMNIRKHFDISVQYLDRLGESDLAFQVEAVPVYMRTKPMLMFRGVFDAGDVQIIRAVANTAVGICDVLAGQDVTTDMLTLIGLVKEVPGKKKSDAKQVLQYVAYLLIQDDRFLTLHPQDGLKLFADSRDRFAAAAWPPGSRRPENRGIRTTRSPGSRTLGASMCCTSDPGSFTTRTVCPSKRT